MSQGVLGKRGRGLAGQQMPFAQQLQGLPQKAATFPGRFFKSFGKLFGGRQILAQRKRPRHWRSGLFFRGIGGASSAESFMVERARKEHRVLQSEP
jgi:hypothetical protein